MSGSVVAVHRSAEHQFGKTTVDAITLVAGLGVEGDAHQGARVRHRSRVRADPAQPNLRQVHLMHAELFEELARKGFTVGPGQLGENITTRGIDLLSLPTGSTLRIGNVLIALTGLRNPCAQIDSFQPGLLKEVALKKDGRLVRKAGVMGVVITSGEVRRGDAIEVSLPPGPPLPLERV
ncbi:MAG: MOSC domain-containing protein [Myxococcota bacterium]